MRIGQCEDVTGTADKAEVFNIRLDTYFFE